MSKLPISLQKKAKDYKNLSDAAKEKLLRELYVNREMSYPQIAEVVDSYAKKVSRDAKKLGIESRTLAEAQSLALKNDLHKQHLTTLQIQQEILKPN